MPILVSMTRVHSVVPFLSFGREAAPVLHISISSQVLSQKSILDTLDRFLGTNSEVILKLQRRKMKRGNERKEERSKAKLKKILASYTRRDLEGRRMVVKQRLKYAVKAQKLHTLNAPGQTPKAKVFSCVRYTRPNKV